MTKKIMEEVLDWCLNESNKGISSETIALTASNGYVTGPGSFGPGYPYDNSDFYRCVLFKNRCPTAFEAAKPLLSDYSKVWACYFESWEYMERIMMEQVRKERDGHELYNYMEDIQNKARQCTTK